MILPVSWGPSCAFKSPSTCSLKDCSAPHSSNLSVDFSGSSLAFHSVLTWNDENKRAFYSLNGVIVEKHEDAINKSAKSPLSPKHKQSYWGLYTLTPALLIRERIWLLMFKAKADLGASGDLSPIPEPLWQLCKSCESFIVSILGGINQNFSLSCLSLEVLFLFPGRKHFYLSVLVLNY